MLWKITFNNVQSRVKWHHNLPTAIQSVQLSDLKDQVSVLCATMILHLNIYILYIFLSPFIWHHSRTIQATEVQAATGSSQTLTDLLTSQLVCNHTFVSIFCSSTITVDMMIPIGHSSRIKEKTPTATSTGSLLFVLTNKCKIIYPMHTIHPFQIKMFIFKVFRVCHFSLAIIFLRVELSLIQQLGHVT